MSATQPLAGFACTIESVRCDLCGSPDYDVLWDKSEREARGALRSVVVRDAEGAIVHGRVVMCRQCGLVYTSPRMTRESLAEFYRGEYRRIYPTSEAAEERHARRAAEIVGQCVDYRIRDGRCLDVGCGTGAMLAITGEWCEQWGLEPGYAGPDPRILASSLDEYAPDAPFDLVTMLNTLEHVPSPTEALRKLRSLLADGGKLLVSVPLFGGRLVNIPPDAWLSCAHLYHFDPPRLTSMMQKAGLRPIKHLVAAEEVGEKLYVLAEKAEDIEIDLYAHPTGWWDKYLSDWDRVWLAKQQIAAAGWR